MSAIEMHRQIQQLKLDDLAKIIMQIYLALYAEGAPDRIDFNPDKPATSATAALVAAILEEYGLRPSMPHAVTFEPSSWPVHSPLDRHPRNANFPTPRLFARLLLTFAVRTCWCIVCENFWIGYYTQSGGR